jgi:hypothetical protein
MSVIGEIIHNQIVLSIIPHKIPCSHAIKAIFFKDEGA